MKNYYNNADCISYEQLRWYIDKSITKEEYKKIYKHLTTCELCANAVNGFSASPFTKEAVNKLHREIDVKVKTGQHWNSILFAQVCIIMISLFAIFGFYMVVDGVAKNKKQAISETVKSAKTVNVLVDSCITTGEAQNDNRNKIKNSADVKRKISIKHIQKFYFEPMESIVPTFYLPIKENTDENDFIHYYFDRDVVYIQDLKVAGYRSLYFSNSETTLDLRGHTPAIKENKEAVNDEFVSEDGQSISAITVLQKGLHSYKKAKYIDAISQFNSLLENNPDDVNALFYKGRCLFEMKNFGLAANYFLTVLDNSNSSFYEEAKWNLALAYKEKGDVTNSTILSNEIINEKGFYLKQAKKLKKEN